MSADRNPADSAGVCNAFTVDVEDYFQVSAFENHFPREAWGGVELRLETGLNRILEICEERGVRGTFFVLGWLARARPELVRRIADGGHEIGCHSQEHRLVYQMTPSEFRRDLREALSALQDAAGAAVPAFRAPSFSIVPRSLWALEILAEEGLRLDSSIYPVRHDRYGMAGAPRWPFRPLRGFPDFVEFPPSTVRWMGLTLPCAGGGYLRLAPLAWTLRAVRSINRREARPAVVYCHPWELDPRQPRVRAGVLKNFRHRVGLSRTADRLRSLLGTFRFGTLSEAVESLGGPRSFPLHALSPREVAKKASHGG